MEPLTDSLRNPARLAALADTNLPDSAAEEQFDLLTRISSLPPTVWCSAPAS
jgi:hypothetical protein